MGVDNGKDAAAIETRRRDELQQQMQGWRLVQEMPDSPAMPPEMQRVLLKGYDHILEALKTAKEHSDGNGVNHRGTRLNILRAMPVAELINALKDQRALHDFCMPPGAGDQALNRAAMKLAGSLIKHAMQTAQEAGHIDQRELLFSTSTVRDLMACMTPPGAVQR